MQIYAKPIGTGSWENSGSMIRSSKIKEIERFISKNKNLNIYFNMALMGKVSKGRGTSKDAKVLPALFADIDTADGEHGGARPSKKQVAQMLRSGDVVPMPSFVVDSGGGIHAYWFFDKALEIESQEDLEQAKTLLEGLNDQLKSWHTGNNFKYERLKDLARVLRVPGTFNHKTDPPKEVSILWPKNEGDIATYSILDLTFEVEKPKTESISDFDMVDDDQCIKIATQACLKIAPEWNDDASGYILRCCRQCVRAGCSIQQTVRVIAAMNEIQGPLPKVWTPEEIAKRYESAKEQSTLGENAKKTYKLDEFGFVERINDASQGKIVYVSKWRSWFAWDGRKFDMDDGKYLRGLIEKTVEEALSDPPGHLDEKELKEYSRQISGFRSLRGFKAVDQLLRTHLTVDHTHFNAKHDLFHCDNGVLWLDGPKTEFKEHSPHNLNTLCSQVVFNPDAKCPQWIKYINQVTDGDKDLALYLQQVVGYCLTTSQEYQAMFVAHGDGSNGKSVFTNMIQRLLGPYASASSQGLLMEKGVDTHLDLVGLYQKRCVIVQETGKDCRLNENKVKMITGGDAIRARNLYEQYWDFQPTHKIILSTNHLPSIYGTDDGIWRRIKLIPFKRKFNGDERDPAIEKKLAKELSGILNWAIEGLGLLRDFGWCEPEAIRVEVEEYKESLDVVDQFLKDCYEFEEGAITRSSELYQALELYCKENGHPRVSDRSLSAEMRKRKIAKKRTDSFRYWEGIKAKTEF